MLINSSHTKTKNILNIDELFIFIFVLHFVYPRIGIEISKEHQKVKKKKEKENTRTNSVSQIAKFRKIVHINFGFVHSMS